MTRAGDHEDRKHRGRRAADQHADEMPQRQRPAHRQRGHVDPRADRRIRRIGDAGGGQDQPELQIEPWRGNLRADRSRGRLQELDDLFRGHVHRQNLVRRSSGKSDSNGGQISTNKAGGPSIHRAGVRVGELRALKIGHIAALAEMGWRSTVATIRMQVQVFAAENSPWNNFNNLAVRGKLDSFIQPPRASWMEGARYFEDGRLVIFKRSGIFYARLRTSGSAKYIWRSLKTTDEQAAIQLGRRLLFQIEQRADQGLPPKSKLFSTVIDDYIRYRERDHAHGRTTEGMLRQIIRVSKFWREYAG